MDGKRGNTAAAKPGEKAAETMMRAHYSLILSVQLLGSLGLVSQLMSPWLAWRLMVSGNGLARFIMTLALSRTFASLPLADAAALYPPGVSFRAALAIGPCQILFALLLTPTNRMRLSRLVRGPQATARPGSASSDIPAPELMPMLPSAPDGAPLSAPQPPPSPPAE